MRPHLEIESPQGHVAVFDPQSFPSVIITEDVARTKNAHFGDPTCFPVDRAMAESQVRTLAALHAAHWGGKGLDAPEFSWLRTAQNWWRETDEAINFKGLSIGPGIAKSMHVLPPILAARKEELWPAHMRALQLNQRGPITLPHQDLHLGNWYCAEDGTMGLIDWQCIASGGGIKDVGPTSTSAVSAASSNPRRSTRPGRLPPPDHPRAVLLAPHHQRGSAAARPRLARQPRADGPGRRRPRHHDGLTTFRHDQFSSSSIVRRG